MRRRRLAGVMAWMCASASAVLLVSACGSSGGSQGAKVDAGSGGVVGGNPGVGGASGASGGEGGAGASNGGATSIEANGGAGGSATDGGVTTSGISPVTACRRYLEAECARRAYCNGDEEDRCLEAEDQCPDEFFSPGSNRTPDTLVACAAQWTTFACNLLAANTAPLCALPGSRGAHEPCAFGTQCASLSCSAPLNGCGECAPAVGSGAPCDTTVVCPPNETCLSTCVAPPSTTPTVIEGQPGGVCNGSCVEGYVCENGLCAPGPAIGDACTVACRLGAYCDSTNHCAAAPPAGQHCASDEGSPYHCAIGAHCLPNDCIASVPLGAACDPPEQCASPASCVVDAHGAHVCKTPREEGDACAGANDACVAGTACAQGRCVASGLQGLFEKQCAGSPDGGP